MNSKRQWSRLATTAVLSASSNSKTAEEDRAALIANEPAEMLKCSKMESTKQQGDIIDNVNETMTEFIKWIREIKKNRRVGSSANCRSAQHSV